MRATFKFKTMRITNFKDVSKDRIFRNKKALKRLLKKKGYFVRFDSDYCFYGIFAISEKKALCIESCKFTGNYDNRETVKIIERDNKTFILS